MNKKYFLNITLVIFSCLFCLALSPSTHASLSTQNHTNDIKNPAKYSFIQSAAKAHLEIDQEETNTFTITLKNVASYVTYFTERPRRDGGTMSIEKFIKMWERNSADSLKNDPPNADLHGIVARASHKTLNLVVELKNPRYDGKSKTLTYTAKPIKGDLPSISKSVMFEHVILFIDDVCLSCWGG